jgi:hypothetical protein
MMADKRQRAMASALMDENLLARLGQGYEAQPYGFTPSRFPRLQMQATTPAEAMNADGIGAFSPELSAGMVPPLAEQRTMSGAVDPGSIYQGSRPSFLANAIDAFRGRQTPSRPSALAQALAAGVPGGETISQFARDVYEGAATNRNGMFAPQPAKPVEPAQNNLSNPDYGTDERTSYSRLSNPDYGTDEPPTAAPTAASTAAPPMPAPITIADRPVYEPGPVPEPPTRPPGLGANSISNSPYATNAQQGAFNAMDDRFSAQNFAYSGGGRPQPTPEAADGASQAATSARAGGSAAATERTTEAAVAPQQFAPLFAEMETKYGLPKGYLAQTARIESNFDPNAQNPNSSAGGLFQFINSTARQYGLANRFDAGAATEAAARLAFDNKAHLQRVLGREPTAGELYLAHQQGATGAAKLLLNPDAPASSLVGDAAARLNRGANMTARAFANQWTSKFDGMPAVTPGPGAKQVPLTTAQAAPNTARPVAGDDPETLEADARYYEKTNPRAAAEFRARAEIARRKAAPRVAALSQHLRGTA